MVTSTGDDERAVLAAVLSGYRDLPQLQRIISGSDFDQPVHETLWDALCAIHRDGNTPDPTTVRIQLGSAAERLPGGAGYLAELLGEPIVPFQAPIYAKAVKDHSIRRTLRGLGARLQQLEADTDTDPDELLSRARNWMDALTSTRTGDLIDATTAFEQVIDITENGAPNYTPTLWAGLNEMIRGWYPGRLYIVGARPGVGKSLMLENAATHVSRQPGKHVLFVSLEMSAMEITQRTLAWTAKVNLSKLQDKIPKSDTDLDKIAACASTMTSQNIRFSEASTMKVADIRGAAWEARQEAVRAGGELAMVVVDYLQLVTATDTKLSRQQQIGEMTRELKKLSKELQVPVLVAAQLSRENQKRQSTIPMLHDLREAGDIEQDADVVIFLHEEMIEDGGRRMPPGTVDMIVAKNRHGQLSTRTFDKVGHFARIADQRPYGIAAA